MTQLGVEKEPLQFEITSTRISNDDIIEKKHIIYTLQIRHGSAPDESPPSSIERRYTHFYNLYNDLRREHPSLMSSVSFPKKALFGNFDSKLISERILRFQDFLKHIASDNKLTCSASLLKFLQEIELNQIRKLLERNEYALALPSLENSFRLLNKVYTDRSPAVLLSLCRVLGVCVCISGAEAAQKWADLALHRYEAVSDSDLLELYVPLLRECIKVWRANERNAEGLENRVVELRKQGMAFREQEGLLEAVDEVEKRLFPS